MNSIKGNTKPDLFTAGGAERLPLVDADIRLWRETDLGIAADTLMQKLIENTAWRQERITVYGKPYLQPRLSAWHGEVGYRYSGIRLEPNPWTPLLADLRQRIEALTGLEFNSVLLNYYRNQADSMGMHSDDERELGPEPAIASLSLGAERRFVLRHRRRRDLETLRLPLPSGSLLLMQGSTQQNWRHGIAKQTRSCGARVNLTFRYVYTRPAPASRAPVRAR